MPYNNLLSWEGVIAVRVTPRYELLQECSVSTAFKQNTVCQDRAMISSEGSQDKTLLQRMFLSFSDLRWGWNDYWIHSQSQHLLVKKEWSFLFRKDNWRLLYTIIINAYLSILSKILLLNILFGTKLHFVCRQFWRAYIIQQLLRQLWYTHTHTQEEHTSTWKLVEATMHRLRNRKALPFIPALINFSSSPSSSQPNNTHNNNAHQQQHNKYGTGRVNRVDFKEFPEGVCVCVCVCVCVWGGGGGGG